MRTIVQRLNTTFVTPFDREDIHALAEELDDVVDDMLEVSHRMQITGITSALPELKEQADLLVQAADETRALLERLESMRGCNPPRRHRPAGERGRRGPPPHPGPG